MTTRERERESFYSSIYIGSAAAGADTFLKLKKRNEN
jgi:hypothetical protein